MRTAFLYLTCMAALILVMLTTPLNSQADRAVGCFAVLLFTLGLTVAVTGLRRRV